MSVNKMDSFLSNSSSATEKSKSCLPQSQHHESQQHTAPVKGQDSQWNALHRGKPKPEQFVTNDHKSKRRVAVCDATDEAKESRCHMRVIMKKF